MNRKNLLQWLPLAALALGLLTDLRPVVLGAAQRGLLATGLWQAPLPARSATPVVPTGAGASYPHRLTLITPEGKRVPLRELRGKAVFVNLWASWCAPCVAEMPGIQALYEKVDTSKVAFVLLALDENPARARALVRRRGYTFPVYFPAGPLPPPFDSNALPATVILDPTGQVAARHQGMAAYDTPEFQTALEALAGPGVN